MCGPCQCEGNVDLAVQLKEVSSERLDDQVDAGVGACEGAVPRHIPSSPNFDQRFADSAAHQQQRKGQCNQAEMGKNNSGMREREREQLLDSTHLSHLSPFSLTFPPFSLFLFSLSLSAIQRPE